ncbi:MAG: hypothetical protein D6722_01840 [Bacteroidetes bacterium]|nr:MAG: hypothetical protein D6722_01840 [Bacteroidota bacterium]
MSMFRFFRRNKNGTSAPSALKMADVHGNPLVVGDVVESLRYDLGLCRLIETPEGLAYESLETGEQVSYLRMVDAATSFQKVRKTTLPDK